ncbi:hypothetical protein RRG08_064184 [Elysia crispata]|uniref:Calpain-5 n=1 Tax=Elysia crispata TaxID=231223 RepID=A0AAE0YFM9_9GAST|nr:hypothetical protein RRG08_064184 [Elysia crispata]
MPVDFRKQSYTSIKKACLSKGQLFEDPEFPATSKSIYFSKICNDVEWMRPRELCKVPRLVVDGVTYDDLVTGEIKNSWFITACTSLAHVPSMWNKVIPDAKSQEFDAKNPYAGIFRFNFWRFGEIIEVVIDDRLPTRDGKLIFVHSKQKNEFWSALLEKAYAKLFGDYETLGTGHTSDALVDFTGGVSEKLDIASMKLTEGVEMKAFFNKLEAASENKALINCHIRVPPRSAPMSHTGPARLMEPQENADGDDTRSQRSVSDRNSEAPQAFEQPSRPAQIGSKGPHGLLVGQGYNITMVRSVEVKKSLQPAVGAATLQLVRLYNPWPGNDYTGPWSDTSKEWKSIPASEWAKMGVKFEKEGEFWMSFEDWCKYFTEADICHFVNTSFFTLKKTWIETICFSEWSSAGRNGGNNWDSLSFLSNPQYMFDITTEEPDVVMISLEQRDVTEGRVAVGDKKNTIGFYVMKVEANRQYRIHIKGQYLFKSQFLMSRNVFGTCTLPKGRYVIIPCCANAGAVGPFMLRLYTSNKTAGRELTKECPPTGCCAGKVKLVTTITVDRLDGLALPEKAKGTLDPYVTIRCEGEKVQSETHKDNRSPELGFKATFYRKKPANPIVVEVYNKNRMFDDFLSEAKVDWPGPSEDPEGSEKGDKKVYNLYGKGKEADIMKPGSITVFIRSSDDPAML